MKTQLILSSLLFLALCACTREQTPSRIVKLAEESGAGPLDGVGELDMRLWLNAHPQVGTRVDALCAPLRANAAAAWPQTTEGRLCVAARISIGQRPLQRKPDNAGFLPGCSDYGQRHNSTRPPLYRRAP